MNGLLTLHVERIELTLRGMLPADARRLADGLDAALASRLHVLATHAIGAPASTLLATDARGPALVDAVAARLAELIAGALPADTLAAARDDGVDPAGGRADAGAAQESTAWR